MYTDNIKKIFFYGIGGMGISAIARMMLSLNKIVVGQDIISSQNLLYLKDLGADITIGQDISAIPKDTDVIVYSRAIEVLHPEFLAVLKQLSIPLYVYPEMLGIVSKDMYTIAISGAHGKTTTTGMVAHILSTCGKDPTVVIGSYLQGTHSNFIQGKSNYFVVEADEYHRAFLNIYPQILIIINIDLDHVDYYKDIDDVIDAYNTIIKQVPPNGYIICDTQDSCLQKALVGHTAQVIDYRTGFEKRLMKVPGDHIQFDAACAAIAAHLTGIEMSDINKALELFPGTWKRFEYKGETKTGSLVYDDFAHHPVEIQATLRGVRELYTDKKIVVIFQPHLFTRTKAFFEEFARSFNDCDELLLLPIYKGREDPDDSINSSMLAGKINQNMNHAIAYDFDTINMYISSQIEKNIYDENTLILTMGAGDAYLVGEKIVV